MPDTNNTPRQLSLAQSKAYAGFAAGLSVSEISRQTGISRQTLHTWLKSDPLFIQAIKAAKQEYIDAFRDRLFNLSRKALDRLEAILEDPKTPAGVALRAALAVLNRPDPGWNLPLNPDPPLDFQNPPAPQPDPIANTPDPPASPAGSVPPPETVETGTGQNLTPNLAPPVTTNTGQNQLDALDHLFLKTLIAANSPCQKTPQPQSKS
jgi:hypothetical protein